ncbi:C40 family peptidase [Nocardia sp. R16R-3T]
MAPGTVAPPAGASAPPAGAGAAPAGQVVPDQRSTTAAAEQRPEQGPGLDPDLIAAAVPAMAMLPMMIASALSGLGGSGGGSGKGSGSGSGGSSSDTGTSSGLTPEAEEALKTLKLLAAVYGDGDSSDPEVKELRKELGVSGSGNTAGAIKARQLWQANAAAAFNNLDNQLASYIIGLAGNHTIDKKAVSALIREVNVALAELGTQAYTKAGQQKVHQILTTALHKAQRIVTGTHASASDTAKAINRLTGQYLYNLNGQQYPSSTGSSSEAAKVAMKVALAQLGDPYEWGAEGPGSFDCSGLMQYAAAKSGVRIPRTAAEQYRQLPKVNPATIRPGDLIFPDSEFNNGNPQHVMMYIGNGQCVEAPRTGLNVRVTSLPKSYHASRYA